MEEAEKDYGSITRCWETTNYPADNDVKIITNAIIVMRIKKRMTSLVLDIFICV